MKDFKIDEAIQKRRIVPFSDGPKLINKELKTAKDDLNTARDSFSREEFKWATTQAYYAYFHTCRALLYAKKYREKSHIQLGFAIKALYVDKNLLPKEYYDGFIQSLNLRELADYKSKFSKKGAENTIKTAEEAINQVKKLLGKK